MTVLRLLLVTLFLPAVCLAQSDLSPLQPTKTDSFNAHLPHRSLGCKGGIEGEAA